MKLTILFILAGAAMAEQPKPKQIAEVPALKLEVASLKLDLMTKELEAIHRERNEVIKGICAAADIPLDQCLIDPAKRTVTAKEKDAK